MGRLCVVVMLGVAARAIAACVTVEEPTAITASADSGPVLVDARPADDSTSDAPSDGQSVATPTIGGCENSLVTIATLTPGATIHYTLDGTIPDATSSLYSEPLVHKGGTLKLKAIALKEGLRPSDVAEYACFSDPPPFVVAAPTLDPDGGTFAGPISFTMQSATPNAVIFYTLDGGEPSATSGRYEGAVTITTSTTVRAVAAYPSFRNSATTLATFTIADASP